MYLTAKSRSDYAHTLVKLCARPNGRYSYDSYLKSIRRLGSIDSAMFWEEKSALRMPTWDGTPIALPHPVSLFDDIVVSDIMDESAYPMYIAYGIEYRVREIFRNGDARLLCRTLAGGDEALRLLLLSLLQKSCIFTPVADGPTLQVILFPCRNDGVSIAASLDLPRPYEEAAGELYVFLGLVQKKNLAPLGVYTVENTRYEVEDMPAEVNPGEYTMSMSCEEGYRPYKPESFEELLYNVSLGMIRTRDTETLDEIESYISLHSNNPAALRRVLSILVGCNYPHSEDERVKGLLGEVLELLHSSLADEIVRGRFRAPQKFVARIFYQLIDVLPNNLLFQLVDDTELLHLVDEFGILQDNMHRYALAEQIRRFKKSPRLDLTLRQLFNTLDMRRKEMLLWVLFGEN